MLSGIGDRDVLEKFGIPVLKHLPGVGKNLQDHVWSGISGYTNIPMGNSLIRPWPMFKAFLQHLIFKKGPLGNSPLEANAFLKSDPSLLRPDIQFHMAPIAIAPGYSTDIYKLDTFAKKDGYGILVILLRPESKGYITLRSNNPLDAPVIEPCFFSDKRDLEVLLWALKKSLAIASDFAMKEYAPGPIHFPEGPYSDESLKTHIRKSLETLYHPVGTCKMGNDDMSVVNDQLQVYDIKGLRVADASIMPSIVSGNTNAACIMIGEKAAELILTTMEQ
jgi:choline dehydrogenase